jgi:threonine dehydrogenase-like Zn-dependent dehydrogenase
MKALYFDGLIPHFIEKYQTPEPQENEALIRVLVAGICATDIEILHGYKAFKGVPGHEFVGVVEGVNGGYPALVGKRVVGEINLGCGQCEYCARGVERHCVSGAALGISEKDGVFAEYVTLPLKNLWEVPNAVSDEEAVFTEPLAAAFEILEQVHIKPTSRIAVLGDGKLGLLAALVLAEQGLSIVLAGKHESKLAIAAQQRIPTKRIDELLKKRGYEVVVEATGSAGGLAAALDLAKPCGTIILKSTVAPSQDESPLVEVSLTRSDLARIVVDEITVVGSRCGPFPPALSALASGRVNVKPLVSAIYPFDDVMSAIEKTREKSTIKVLLDFRERL